MKIELLSNTKNKDISISNDVFSKEFNESLIHQAVVSFMASSRQGSAKQKNRSEVRGGGKKTILAEQERVPLEVHCGEAEV
jgi:large subunit ribosomal protein L4